MAVPTSIQVLRMSGPLDLREITRLTSKAMRTSLKYADVDSVLVVAQRESGLVRLVKDDPDYRNRVWEAT